LAQNEVRADIFLSSLAVFQSEMVAFVGERKKIEKQTGSGFAMTHLFNNKQL